MALLAPLANCCRAILRTDGVRVDCAEVRYGQTFVWLPERRHALKLGPEPGIAPARRRPDRLDHFPLLIAVVDDDRSILKGLSSLLRSEGYEVDVFAGAEAFLASSASRKAACLVTDIHMPGMNGLSLQATLRATRPELPIIVMTAFGDAATRTKALAQGAQEVLVKPFAAERLLREIGLAVST